MLFQICLEELDGSAGDRAGGRGGLRRGKNNKFFLLEIVMCNLNFLCLKVRQLLRVLRRPFDRQDEAEEAGFSQRPPLWAREVRVSCSS